MRKKEFVSAKEIVTLLGLSRSKVYALLKDGRLPSVKFGRRIIVPTQALMHVLMEESVRTMKKTSNCHVHDAA
jgi:excisionase family DNA binding protein